MVFHFRQKIISFVVSQLLPYIPAPLKKALSVVVLWLHPYFPALQCLQQTKQGRRFACGMFTSTAQDWQVAGLIRATLDCSPENSFWIYGDSGEVVLSGSEFPFELSSNDIYDTSEPYARRKLSEFIGAFLERVQDLVPRLTSDDTLFLVVCGYRSQKGPLLVGNEDTYNEFWPCMLEMVVRQCKANVQLVIPARHGCWASPHWSLLTVGTFAQGQVRKSPLLDLITTQQTTQENECQTPSEATPASDSKSSSGLSAVTPVPLSEEETEELMRLSQEHLHFLPPLTLSEGYLSQKCMTLVKHQGPPHGPLTIKQQVKTLNALRLRSTYRHMSLNIAQKLGWEAAVEKVGDPFGGQRLLGTDLPLQSRVAEHGYILFDLHVFSTDTFWMGAAGWLARIWEAAGEPTIAGAEWKRVLNESCWEAGVTLR